METPGSGSGPSTSAARERRRVRLVAAERLTPLVRALRFEAPADRPLQWVAGQWVNLYPIVDGAPVQRSYSIACSPRRAEAGCFEVAVTHVEGGPASTALHALEVGDELEMDGPFGFFTRERADRSVPAVFVATGTGVTPIRAMLEEEAHDASAAGPPLVLLFGCRTEADLLYEAEWRELEAALPRFRFVPTLSRAGQTWPGARGWVTAHYRELIAPLSGAHVYVCGLQRMVNEVRRISKEDLGMDRKQIHTERYD